MEFENVEANSERWLSLEDLLNEEWKDIKGYEGRYQVSNYGRVKSFVANKGNKTKILHLKTNGHYYIVDLSKNGNIKRDYVHRIEAREFLQNIKNKETINHKNCNKLDNRLFNIEWNTRKENQQHAIKNNCIKTIKITNLSYDFLYQEYIINKKSANRISKESNGKYSTKTIQIALKNNGIKMRTPKEAFENRRKFKNIDFEKRLQTQSVAQLARELNTTADYLYHFLPKIGIIPKNFQYLDTRKIERRKNERNSTS